MLTKMSKTRIALKNSMKKSAFLSCSIFIAWCNPLHAQQDNFQLLAAYEGNPEAQFQLALTYSKQATNFKLAAYWYKQAARQGMADAQYNLGHFYLQGLGVKQSTNETIKWWQQAAHQNYAPAQHNLGTAYFEGVGVEKNNDLAKQWFLRCEKLGNTACTESLRIVRANEDTDGEPAVQPELLTQEEPSTQLISKSTTDEVKVDKKILIHINAKSDSTVVAELDSPEEFSVLQSTNDWQQVQLKTPIAVWSYKPFVSIENSIGTITGDKVRARTAPSINNSKIITELSINTQLEVLEETDKWVKLALNDYIAWTPLVRQTIAKEDQKPITTTAALKQTNESDNSKETPSIKAPKKLVSQYSFLDRRSDDDWLFSSDPEKFTVLLGNYDNSKDLTQFAQENQLLKHKLAHLLLAKRGNIEWKYVLYGNFNSTEDAIQSIKNNGFKYAFVAKLGNIQEQRCSAWKTTIPSPKTLEKFCLKKTTSTS